MLYHVLGVGRLVADAEIRVTTETSQLVEFRTANSERVKRGNEYVEEPTFTTIKLWLHKDSKLPEYLKKGQEINLLGKLKQENWEAEGQKRSKLVVIGLELGLVGGKGNGTREIVSPESVDDNGPTQEAPAETGAPVDEDDIPF